MNRSVKGFLMLVALISALSAYAWWQFYGDTDREPTLSEKAHDIRKKTKEPIKEFEKDMGERVKNAKGNGVDLTQPVKR